MIKIIDYGLGNIQAFVNVYRRLHIPVGIAKAASDFSDADRLILPGVGAFDHAIHKLNDSGMRDALENAVQVEKKPVLGICVGMQMLADSSDEGVMPGLGWIPGKVRSFESQSESQKLPLPHMGWNDINPTPNCPLFKTIENDARFYFLHSYYFENKKEENVAAKAGYGLHFSCAVRSDHIFGVQFHPEKSHRFGVTLLKNFAEYNHA